MALVMAVLIPIGMYFPVLMFDLPLEIELLIAVGIINIGMVLFYWIMQKRKPAK